jgi:integrase
MQHFLLMNSLKLAHRVGLVNPCANSNHLAPTKKVDFQHRKSTFLLDWQMLLADTSVIKRKPLKSLSGYPYRPARIVPRPFDITKRWYIVFYAWDVGKEKLSRKRVLHDELMEIPDLDRRLKFAADASEEISYFLKNDWHLPTSPKPKTVPLTLINYSLLDAFDFAVTYKKERQGIKQTSIDTYTTVRNTIISFLEHKKLSVSYSLRNTDYAFWDLYFEYIKIVRKVRNNTYNHRRGLLHAMYVVLLKKDNKILNGKNPIAEIDTLKVSVSKHAAFTDQQLRKLSSAVQKKEPHIFLFMQFMFYTLARPNEIRQLKIGNIDLDKRRILIPAEDSKTDIGNYVGISDRFAEIIKESEVLDYPSHYYVFNNTPYHVPGQKIKHDHRPGLIKPGEGYFYKRIVKHIISEGLRDINSNFTPYAIKHTGAISLYLATKDVKIIQAQCRHQNMETTLKYLRDLGLFTDFDQLNKWKGPI